MTQYDAQVKMRQQILENEESLYLTLACQAKNELVEAFNTLQNIQMRDKHDITAEYLKCLQKIRRASGKMTEYLEQYEGVIEFMNDAMIALAARQIKENVQQSTSKPKSRKLKAA